MALEEMVPEFESNIVEVSCSDNCIVMLAADGQFCVRAPQTLLPLMLGSPPLEVSTNKLGPPFEL